MSLAITAAPIENDNQYSETPLNRKRQSHNKTQRKNYMAQEDFNPEKVNSVLQSIHNKLPDEGDELCDYNSDAINVKKNNAPALETFKPLNPMAPPQSMGTERTKEGMKNMYNNSSSNLVPQPVQMDDLELQSLQSAFMNDSQVRDYYKKLTPNLDALKTKMYNHQHQQQQQGVQDHGSVNDIMTNQILLEKLNYMINLLEEKKDERTNNVTEEVILYSFLGIFMIFIVDSFSRVGKYVR
jgi:hypothetical protein